MVKIIFIHGLLGSKNNFQFLEKKLSAYETSSIDLIGFAEEDKPDIRYDVGDFLNFLHNKLDLSNGTDEEYILIGHSLGALLAKELTIKYPHRILKSFLIAYPFLEKDKALQARNYFDMKYAKGAWWTKVLCKTEILYKWLFYPYIFLFRYKYRKSYLDAFKHTYQSAYGTIKNTILQDKREGLHEISN